MEQRSGVNQAAYSVAKLFGHRSSYRDLELWGPGRTHNLAFGGEDCMPATNVTKVDLWFRLAVLGKETMKGLRADVDRLKFGHTSAPNRVTIDLKTPWTGKKWFIGVNMEMSGPALMSLCQDLGAQRTAQQFANLIRGKWGAIGVAYGEEMTGIGEKTTGRKGSFLAEGYEYIRRIDGVDHNNEDGIGWIQ